ncbi:MAG: oxygenase MpaB family protein [Daejeonella sp.]|uniref:oxygenase MpaB family protein n=1 Tax=Daejeonella sp. TaxID=2805397 RepID=UPI003C739FD0
MVHFVDEKSIVRKIWGNADTILFIFAGASSDFALNKAVDWLYFTGRLPADPIGRLFSTVGYARKIVFAKHDEALRAIDQITAIHKNVETSRGSAIPDWAYRDVLYMLIDYSIRAFEVLERELTEDEKTEVFKVFNSVGQRMGIKELPDNFDDWQADRRKHLEADLEYSNLTRDLYKQYRKHLGVARYVLLTKVQALICPPNVRLLLSFKGISFITPMLTLYRLLRFCKMNNIVKSIILPEQYQAQIVALNVK